MKQYTAQLDPLIKCVEDSSRLPAKPFVSVAMTTYNHEPFIAQALDSILMQEVDFDYEIVIGEDNSTDCTREILLDYQHRHPDKIRLRLARENLYSQGLKPGAGVRAACRGKYIALLEGDDYWTDPLKLQKQVDFLETDQECSLVFHAAQIISACNKKPPYVKKNATKDRYFSIEELIMGGGGLIVTNSMVFSNALLRPHMAWFKNAIVGDYPLAISAGLAGRVFYIDQVMSVYRTDVKVSVTSRRNQLRYDDFIDRALKVMSILKEFDRYTMRKYSRVVNTTISKYLYSHFKERRNVPLIAQYKAYRKLKYDFQKIERSKAVRMMIMRIPFVSRFFVLRGNVNNFFKRELSFHSVTRGLK